MRRSTFLFYVIAFPGFVFIIFFFKHAIVLLPLLFAFLKHLCYGWNTLFHTAPIVLTQTFFVLSFFFIAVVLCFTKIFSFFGTAWKVRHLKHVIDYQQFFSLQNTYHKVIIFSSKNPSAFCYFGTIYVSSGLYTTLNEK